MVIVIARVIGIPVPMVLLRTIVVTIIVMNITIPLMAVAARNFRGTAHDDVTKDVKRVTTLTASLFQY